MKKKRFTGMGSVKLSELGSITEDEKKMIADAAKRPIVYDEDSPEMTPEMLSEFRKISEINKKSRSTLIL